jgi:transcriptional regulator with XRE-family HTH domain
MTTTATITPTDVAAAWRDAYDAWENGDSVSPSADDLVRIALHMLGVDADVEFLSDCLWEMENDGTELIDQANFLFTHMGVTA